MDAFNTILSGLSDRLRALLLTAKVVAKEVTAAILNHEHLIHIQAGQYDDSTNENEVSHYLSRNRKYDEISASNKEWLYINPDDPTSNGATIYAPAGIESASYQVTDINEIGDIVKKLKDVPLKSLAFGLTSLKGAAGLVKKFVRECAFFHHATLTHSSFRVTIQNFDGFRDVTVTITSPEAIPAMKALPYGDEFSLAYNFIFLAECSIGPEMATINFAPLAGRASIRTIQFQAINLVVEFLKSFNQDAWDWCDVEVISGLVDPQLDSSEVRLDEVELGSLEFIFVRGVKKSPFQINERFRVEDDAMPCYAALGIINGTLPNGVCISTPQGRKKLGN